MDFPLDGVITAFRSYFVHVKEEGVQGRSVLLGKDHGRVGKLLRFLSD